MFSSEGKKVIAVNVENKTLVMYNSAAQFIRTHNLSKKAVTVSLKNNRIRDFQGWVVLYHTLENIQKLKSYLLMPVDE